MAAARLEGGGHVRVRALEAGCYLLELADKDLRRIHRTPGSQIIVRKADHRGAVACGFAPKRVGGTDLHRRAINHATVKREFAERRAVFLPGPHDLRREHFPETAL